MERGAPSDGAARRRQCAGQAGGARPCSRLCSGSAASDTRGEDSAPLDNVNHPNHSRTHTQLGTPSSLNTSTKDYVMNLFFLLV